MWVNLIFYYPYLQREDSAKRKDSTASSSAAERSNSLSKKSKKSISAKGTNSTENNEINELNARNTSLSSRLSSTGEYIPYSEDYLDQGTYFTFPDKGIRCLLITEKKYSSILFSYLIMLQSQHNPRKLLYFFNRSSAELSKGAKI